MPKQLEVVSLIPRQAHTDVKHLMPALRADAFESLSFWNKLTEREQTVLKAEGQELAATMYMSAVSDLAMGMHLQAIYDLLHPKNCFQKFLHKFTRMSTKQVYRLMAGYSNAKALLPEPVIKAAMAKGVRLMGDDEKKPLGVYTHAYKLLGPPPRNTDPETAAKYVDDLELTYKEHKKRVRKKAEKEEPSGDPQEMLVQSYRFVSSRLKRLTNSRSRQSFVEKLFGFILTDIGVSSQLTIAPQAAPESYKPKPVGRPTLVKGEKGEKTRAVASGE